MTGSSSAKRSSPRKRWTDADDAALARMVGNKRSEAEICARLGRTVAAVRQRKARLGLGGDQTRVTEAEAADIRRRYRLTGSYAETAAAVGRAAETVRRIVLGLDQKSRRPRDTHRIRDLGPPIAEFGTGVKAESAKAAGLWDGVRFG